MIPCNSLASLHVFEPMHLPSFAIVPLAPLPALVDDQPMYHLPNSANGVVSTTVCILENPPSQDISIHTDVLPTDGQEVVVIRTAHGNL